MFDKTNAIFFLKNEGEMKRKRKERKDQKRDRGVLSWIIHACFIYIFILYAYILKKFVYPQSHAN